VSGSKGQAMRCTLSGHKKRAAKSDSLNIEINKNHFKVDLMQQSP